MSTSTTTDASRLWKRSTMDFVVGLPASYLGGRERRGANEALAAKLMRYDDAVRADSATSHRHADGQTD